MNIRYLKSSILLFILLLCFVSLAFSESSLEEQKHSKFLLPENIQTLKIIILKIKEEYVEVLSEQKLADGCLDKIQPNYSSFSEFLSSCINCKHPETEKLPELISQEEKVSFAIIDYINSVASNKDDAQRLLLECKKGMAKGLDLRSSFIDEEEFKSLQSAAKDKSGGIGVEIKTDEDADKNTVVSLLKPGPAHLAGIRVGDIVVTIDGVSIRNLSSEQIINLLRGKIDSHALLEIQRNSTDPLIKYNVQRKLLDSSIFESKLIRPDYAYIRIQSLGYNISKDFSQKLQSLYLENKADLKGLILDLRNNPGGLLSQTSGVVAPFLPQESLVFEVKGRSPEANFKATTNPSFFIREKTAKDFTKKYLPAYKSLPIVILINNKTASGAEIIAGAMQDHKRATIIGQSSFGLSSVQTIFPMWSSEALKITTAYWYTPLGRNVKDKGITPDIVTESNNYINIGTDADLTLTHALEFLMNKY